jgi:hypothetical protein
VKPSDESENSNSEYRPLTIQNLDSKLESKEDKFNFPDGGWVCAQCKNYNFYGRMKCNRCNKAKTTNDVEGKPQHIIRKEFKTRHKNDENDMNDVNKTSKLKLKSKARSFKIPQVEVVQAPICNESSTNVHSERVGDWVCTSCNNLNFSFRKICNRCKITREVSEMHYASMQMYNVSNCGPMINFSIPSMPQGMQYNHMVAPSQPYSASMPMNNGDMVSQYPDHTS